MSLSELVAQEEKCRKRFLETFNAYHKAKNEMDQAQADFDSNHEKLAMARAVSITWETFFELLRNDKNWVEIPCESPLKDRLLCSNESDLCVYKGSTALDNLDDFSVVCRFETVDEAFLNSFTLCDHCLDNQLEDYIDWWMQDMADNWTSYKNGRNAIKIDPEDLCEDGQKLIGYRAQKRVKGVNK